MTGRDLASTASTVLLVVGVGALLVPALFPVQGVLYHQTGPETTAGESELEAQGFTVIEYENLSERGREIYVATLRSPGEYTVPAGEGAPEFPYDGAENLGDVNRSERFEERRRLTTVVIERPEDADLPPPDEPVDRIEAERRPPEGATTSGSETGSPDEGQRAQRRQQVATYDMMVVRRGTAPVTDSGTLLRLGSVLVGTLAIGIGGYLRSRP